MIIRNDADGNFRPAPRLTNRPDPVDGDTVRLSRKATFWVLVGCAIWLAFGGAQVVEWVAEMARWLGAGDPFPSPLLLLMGALHTGGAALVTWFVVRKRLVGRRFVIGADRVQVQEGRGAGTRVLASVPFENMEMVRWSYVELVFKLEVELVDTRDPDTYLPDADVEANFLAHGYHYAFTDRYALPMMDILELMREARDKWRRAPRS